MASDALRPITSRMSGLSVVLVLALVVAAALYFANPTFTAWVNGIIGQG